MRIIVTRPRRQAEHLVGPLRAAALDAAALPLIDIAPAGDSRPIVQAWQRLRHYALVMFVSANAVEHFMAFRPAAMVWPESVLAASTGPGTSAALRAAEVQPPELVAPAGGVFDSEALWERLRARDWTGRQVLVVRGESGRDWLAERLGAAGARVDFVAAYARRAPVLDPAGRALLAQALQQPQTHLWLFSSSEAVGQLGQLVPDADWSRSRALASHPRIAAAARRLGFMQVEPAAATLPALIGQLASIQSAAP